MIEPDEKKTWKAGIYIRRSKGDSGKDECNTIEKQRELLLDFANRNPDICVVDIFADDGATGMNFDRAAFKDMIKHIENGLIDCVIVKDFSRIGRDHIETGKYIEKYFKDKRLIAVSDCYDSLYDDITSDINSFLIPFKNIINEAFIEDISSKTKAQLEAKRRKGEFISNFAVYGYIKQDKSLIVDKYADTVVKSIFEYKIMGYNEAKIAGILTADGVLPPFEYKKSQGIPYYTPFAKGSSIAWSTNSVRRILQNRVYLGHLEQGKRTKANYRSKKLCDKPRDAWSICLNIHEPIIDELDFDIVQELMAMDTRTSRNKEQLHLFSGFLICGLCGQPMTAKTVKKRPVKLMVIMFAPLIRKLGNVKTIILATGYWRELFCSRSGSRLQICC